MILFFYFRNLNNSKQKAHKTPCKKLLNINHDPSLLLVVRASPSPGCVTFILMGIRNLNTKQTQQRTLFHYLYPLYIYTTAHIICTFITYKYILYYNVYINGIVITPNAKVYKSSGVI